MQEQEKMEMVWQAPELVELGWISDATENANFGPGADGGGSFAAS